MDANGWGLVFRKNKGEFLAWGILFFLLLVFTKGYTRLLLMLFFGAVICRMFSLKKQNYKEADSDTVLTATDKIFVRVVGLEFDKVRRYRTAIGRNGTVVMPLARDPGYLEKIIVTFENHTGAQIITDMSFQLERRRGMKWYIICPENCGDVAGEKLLIPEGNSKQEYITFGQYRYLSHGDYRIVKAVKTLQGPCTIAAEFSVGFLERPV